MIEKELKIREINVVGLFSYKRVKLTVAIHNTFKFTDTQIELMTGMRFNDGE